MFENILFFACGLVKQYKNSVFGWFALGAGSHTSEENTVL